MSDTDENIENLPLEGGDQSEPTEKEKIIEEKEHDSGGEEQVKKEVTAAPAPTVEEATVKGDIEVEPGEKEQVKGQEEVIEVTEGVVDKVEEIAIEDVETDKREDDAEEAVEREGEEGEEGEEEKKDEEEGEESSEEEDGEEGIEGDDEGGEGEGSSEEEEEEEEIVEVVEDKEKGEKGKLAKDEKPPLSSSEEDVEELSEEDLEPEPEQWDPDQLLSGPSLSVDSTMPIDIMDFYHCFGFNCRKRFNLEVLDDDTIVFASGNYLNFFSLSTREIKFRRSALGGGIGHIKKNPNPIHNHFSVAECGKKPFIILYKWPGLAVECVLKGGAKRLYSNLDYSPDGEFLVSQSGEPDYMLTVWAWKQHTILLRNKSYINDVYKVMFSPYLAGQITTCGVAHIKFWKMAHTFTGLKLQGELGRFGKTEYSDILGVLPMPDEKVISGCDWGNILIWDGGLIVLEVLRTGRRKCHDAPIVQLFFEEEELWTISLDGHVKIWWYEKIDSADPPDDDPVILLDPSYDFYTPGMSLVSVVKRREDESLFIAQDGNGGIWQIDLNTLDTPTKSIQYYKCHAGKLRDIAPCSFGPYLASFGKDGQIFVYNYLTKKFLYNYQFPSPGRKMIWPSTTIIPSGDIIIAGFMDSQLRVCTLKIPSKPGESENNICLTTTQVIKTHSKPVTAIEINRTGQIVVSGSEDATIFIYKVNNKVLHEFLIPIGFLDVPDMVTYMTWNPKEETTILVGCIHGQMMEAVLPTEPHEDTSVTLRLKKPKCTFLDFMSYKSQIRRNIHLGKVSRHKERRRQKKMLDLIKMQAENPGVDIDEDVFFADSEEEEVLDPLYIPPKQKIFWLQYTDEGTIWVSMSGFDAGYIYEYRMGQKTPEPLKFRMIANADDTEIFSFVYDSQRKYLIFAMQNGSIRVNRVKEDWRDLSDYWTFTMHDNQYGYVPKMCFSYDEKYFFSCGNDGNIFVSKFNHEWYAAPPVVPPTVREDIPVKVVDIDGDIKSSLEEIKYRAEQDRIAKSANAYKAKVREKIKDLRDRYLKVLNRNSKLLPSQIIPREELEPDQRVMDFVNDMFANKIEVIKKKMDYDLQKSEVQMKKLLKYFTDPADKHPLTIKGINNPNLFLISVRQRKMSHRFYDMMEICIEKVEEERIKGRPIERAREPPKAAPVKVAKPVTLEYFLLSLSPDQREKQLGPKLTRMLLKYRARRDKWEKRQEEWEEFTSKKPDPDKNHPEDEKFLAEAIQNIGDYKLKEADDYKAPPEVRDTTVKKYKQVLDTRLKQYNLRHGYMEKVYEIRDLKYQVIGRLTGYKKLLDDIHNELPEKLHQYGPNVPDIDMDEFPEEKLKPVIVLPKTELEELEDEDQVPFVPAPTKEEMLQQVLPQRDELEFPKVNKEVFISSYSPDEIAYALEADFKELLNNYSEDKDTPFEDEMRTRRLTKKLFIQRVTISKMEEEIADFNAALEDAKDERIPAQVKGLFVDIYILTLNQELNILKRMEEGEETLSAKCDKSLRLVHSLEDDIDIEKNKKIEIENTFETNFLEETKIQEKFRHAAENNKFYDFLKRVFRKKYRAPKVTTDSDSESESSSSSSDESVEDDEEGSVDSKDVGIIKQDLNVCPKGCEVAIFNLTVDLRSERHEIEQSNRELARQLEISNKNIDLASRKLQMLMTHLQNSLHDLEVYQKERQDLLNQIKCTVILNLDQIQDYNPETDEISDFLVFSKTTLSELYKRVGILEYENLQQKTKYETYLKHLLRMKRDLAYMRQKIKRFLQQIQLMMYEKFGKAVEVKELEQALKKKTFNKTYINELEEVVLKKLVYEIRVKNTNITEAYGVQILDIKERIRHAQDTLIKCVRENTNRLELLQVMNKEKKELVKVISSQPKRRENLEKVLQTTAEYNKDVKKLEAILENQNRTMFELRAEIKRLKTKGLPVKDDYEEVKTREREAKKMKQMQEKILDIESEREWPEEIENYLKQHESITEEEEFEEDKSPKFGLLHETESSETFLAESEDIIAAMLDELIGGMKLKSQAEIDRGQIIRNILNNIMNCVSMQDLMKEIIANIPFELSSKQRSLVQTSAEKLHAIQEPDMSEDNIIKYARELLEETIEDVFLVKDNPYEILTKLLEELVRSVPKEFLLHEDSVGSIVEKITVYVEIHEVVIEVWVDKVDSVDSPFKEEMIELLNIILEKVFGTGTDYLYVINRNKDE